MADKCIRVFADIQQINNCKKLLEDSEESLNQITRVFNLAGNMIRMKILYLLWDQKRLCVCDLSDILGISIAGVSQHLRKMKDGEVVESEKVAQIIYYSLTPQYKKLLKSFFKRAQYNELISV